MHGLVEIEINQKERQRSSELGISNKYHRRLQTSLIEKSRTNNANEVFSDPESQNANADNQHLAGERRARSSLSNRNHSGNGRKSNHSVKGPAVSGAIATNTSQIMATAAFEASNHQMTGLNSSQPIIFNKGQHNLDLNTNLR